MGEEFTEWNYAGDFLTQFPPRHQGVVGTLFCNKVRGGARDVPTLLDVVGEHAVERINNPFEWDTVDGLATMCILIEALKTAEAERFARFILWRENLPAYRRKYLKATAKAAQYFARPAARQAMAAKPPTEKQLALLKAKQCPTIPRTRLEASELIDGYLNPSRPPRAEDYAPSSVGEEEGIPF
jgi:hypothetical protein